MKPLEPRRPDSASRRQNPVTIADVDAAFHRIGSFRDVASDEHLDDTLIGYTDTMKRRAMLPEHLIMSVRVAALNAVPNLAEDRLTAAIKLCLDRYFE